MKNFFKLTIAKCIIFVILIILTLFIPKTSELCSMTPNGIACSSIPTQGIGYPMFYGEYFLGDVGAVGFNPFTFVLNVIIFYSLSSGIVFLLNKTKKD